ncbi:phosphoribosyltransferase-like protein [Thelonectria olida]|uniref:ribose-phosphate diphosphokinase n=1 Tax=Thelonectria olida TaxID=1576542 RepID=A0A9P8VQL1_9HYPO|nr:phosphoribosyltransferase-like protein [Thelonectria olida]
MSLNSSIREVSVTVGESVRDKDARKTRRGHATDGRMQPRSYNGSPRQPGEVSLTFLVQISDRKHPAKGVNNCQVDNLYAEPSVFRWIQEHVNTEDCIIVSPDAGGATKYATSLASRLGLPFALIHKERPRPNEVGRVVLVGDVVGKIAILVDDIADTCERTNSWSWAAKAASVVKEYGAADVVAIVTHVLSNPAVDTINKSVLSQVVVINTVPIGDKLERSPKLKVIDISVTIAEAIRRTHNGGSVSYLLRHDPV